MTDRRFFPVHDLAFRGAGARTSKIEAETLELMAQAAARERARTPPIPPAPTVFEIVSVPCSCGVRHGVSFETTPASYRADRLTAEIQAMNVSAECLKSSVGLVSE